MKERQPIYPISKYDERHDVLHVYLDSRCNEYEASAEEEYPNIYVMKDDDTDETVGFKILDFKRNAAKVARIYPQYNFRNAVYFNRQ